MTRKSHHILAASGLAAALAVLGYAIHAGAMGASVEDAFSDMVIASRTEALDWLVVLVTLWGDSTALTLIGTATALSLAISRQWRPALVSAGAFIATPLIVKAIKVTVARARPTADLYAGVESFSFPSGHMTNSMVIYGAIAILAARTLTGATRSIVVGGLVLLIAAMGASRVYLGAHWPTDVLGAVLLAAIMLLIIRWGFHDVPRTNKDRRAFTLSACSALAVWVVYGALTLQAGLDMYAIDVTPEGTIELEEEGAAR